MASAGSLLCLIPWGAGEHELHHRVGPTWKQGDRPEFLHISLSLAAGCCAWRARRVATPLTEAPISPRAVLQRSGSCEPSAAVAHSSWGMGALVWERGHEHRQHPRQWRT